MRKITPIIDVRTSVPDLTQRVTGGFDTVGEAMGDDIPRRAMEKMSKHLPKGQDVEIENLDAVHLDLESFMQRIIPDGGQLYVHDSEGPDDMPAHLRSVITSSSLTIPVIEQRLGLGTWQGVYLWEHRYRGSFRRLVVTVYGMCAGERSS